MKTYDYVKAIIAELDHATSQNQAEGIEDLISTIMSSEKVFVSGAGRSGLMGKSFAMRLMHMGINAFVTGETVTPVFTEKDLLIVGTGSGKTESLFHMAEKAKDIGGTVATVTISPDSPIAEISDLILQLPGSQKIKRQAINRRYNRWARFLNRLFYCIMTLSYCESWK